MVTFFDSARNMHSNWNFNAIKCRVVSGTADWKQRRLHSSYDDSFCEIQKTIDLSQHESRVSWVFILSHVSIIISLHNSNLALYILE